MKIYNFGEGSHRAELAEFLPQRRTIMFFKHLTTQIMICLRREEYARKLRSTSSALPKFNFDLYDISAIARRRDEARARLRQLHAQHWLF
jgi:hypothetical protein